MSPISYDVANWSANPWVGGGYAAFMPPGVWTSFGEAIATPVGRIYWADTEIFDGAVRSAEAPDLAVQQRLQCVKSV